MSSNDRSRKQVLAADVLGQVPVWAWLTLLLLVLVVPLLLL